ncbi:MAG: ATP-binding cassette domain-containing protein [Treponemataceae bacterium]
MDSVIKLENVSKNYYIRNIKTFSDYFKFYKPKDKIVAVENISFNIEQGECIGLVGKNSSGKSTLMKLMTGIIKPTKGSVRIFGDDPEIKRKAIVKRIAAVFGQRSQLVKDISAKESYKLLKYIYNVDSKRYEYNVARLTELLMLGDFINQHVRTLSLGQKMRAEFAAAFLHNPAIVFLDEPTLGMDVFTKDIILKFLKFINEEQKTTLIFTTHAVNDIAEICSRILFMQKGVLIADKKISEIDLYDKVDIIVSFDKIIEKFDIEQIHSLNFEVDKNNITVFDVNPKKIGDLINSLSSHGKITDIKILQDNFEKYFKGVYADYEAE